MPPIAAATGSRAAPRSRSSPVTSSRLISSPASRKNAVIKPSFTQKRTSWWMAHRPTARSTGVLQIRSYPRHHGEFAHTTARAAAISSGTALAMLERRNSWSGRTARARGRSERDQGRRSAVGSVSLIDGPSADQTSRRTVGSPDGSRAPDGTQQPTPRWGTFTKSQCRDAREPPRGLVASNTFWRPMERPLSRRPPPPPPGEPRRPKSGRRSPADAPIIGVGAGVLVVVALFFVFGRNGSGILPGSGTASRHRRSSCSTRRARPTSPRRSTGTRAPRPPRPSRSAA